MNEIKFKNLSPIENYEVRFKCFNRPYPKDGYYQATFHVYDKDNDGIHYQVDFEISESKYETTEEGNIKSNKDLINEKYGNLEKCFEEVGHKYLVKATPANGLKNEMVSLISRLSL